MKRIGLFILAFLMAILTTYLFYQYMHGLKAKAATGQTATQTVVVAKVAISKDTTITDKMVGSVKVPKESMQPDAETSVNEVVGKLAAIAIQPNEMILAHHLLVAKTASALAYKIQPGQRAVTVTAAKPADTVANLVEPGDRVDVLLVTKTKTSVLLSNVLVLAVDQRLTAADAKKVSQPYTMTTLEVSPTNATNLFAAEQKGELTFSLRSAVNASKGG